MRKLIVIAAVALAGFASAIPSPVAAKGPGWKANGGVPPGFAQGRKLGWASATHPPGWTHGHKRGWHGRNMPPGLTKPDR
jgi:hypothetical protein